MIDGEKWFVTSGDIASVFIVMANAEGEGPTLYPVACSPQAWAAAAVFASVILPPTGISTTATPLKRFTRRSVSIANVADEADVAAAFAATSFRARNPRALAKSAAISDSIANY